MFRLLLLGACVLAGSALYAADAADEAAKNEAAKGGPLAPSVVEIPKAGGVLHAQVVTNVAPSPSWSLLGVAIPESTVLMILLVIIAVLLGLAIAQLSGLRAAIESKGDGMRR